MNIPFLQADPSNFYSGRGGNSIKYIVVHYTAGNGDTAMNNAQYFHNNSGLQASAHYFVDEHSVVQSVRDTDGAWHCGGPLESSHHPLHNICMNRNSLGVEMCSDIVGGKYTITQQTVDRTVELVRWLMDKYGIDVDHVVRHYDVTGKDCPEPWVRDESLWRKFKARLTAKDPIEEEIKAMTDKEFAQYMDRYLAAKANQQPHPYAAEAWSKAKAARIVDGSKPQCPLTREQLVVILQRLGLLK
jgi:N-acetylmuramoyl-L-alanine amidase CwlA